MSGTDPRGSEPAGASPVILRACAHSGGRSLAAEVLTEHHGGDRVDVRSAGSEPGDSPNPVVSQERDRPAL